MIWVLTLALALLLASGAALAYVVGALGNLSAVQNSFETRSASLS